MLAVQLAFLFMHTADAASSVGSISDIGLDSTAGDKDTGIPATVVVSWQETNLTTESVKVYRDNILMATLSPGEAEWDMTVEGYAEADLSGTGDRTTLSWRFRVELVSSAGALLSTLERSFTGIYEVVGQVT